MQYKLIIFDNDGVLIDSEIVWHIIHAQELTGLGFPLSLEKSLELFSHFNNNDYDEVFYKLFGDSAPKGTIESVNQKTELAYPVMLKPMQNITNALELVDQKKIDKCIVSNGDDDYIKLTMKLTGLDKYFQENQMIGASNTLKAKPEPDLFLHAAKTFGVEPNECLVIEDHPAGIEAACKAKMYTIGFLGASHISDTHRSKLEKAGAEHIVNDAMELTDYLSKHL